MRNGPQRQQKVPVGDPIRDYDVPSDVEGPDGTQDSMAHMTFPKVSSSLPEYMLYIENISLNEDAGEETEGIPGDPDSNDREWIPEFHDTLESGDSDFEEDDVDDPRGSKDGLDSWCMQPEAFTPVHLTMEQLAEYYRKSSWNSASVDFVKSRDDFTGPTPGLKGPTVCGVSRPKRVFNLY